MKIRLYSALNWKWHEIMKLIIEARPLKTDDRSLADASPVNLWIFIVESFINHEKKLFMILIELKIRKKTTLIWRI